LVVASTGIEAVHFRRTAKFHDFGRGANMEYESPKVVDYGTLVDLTAARDHSHHTDCNFPSGTPSHDMCFS
jgi:hypothetical protein